MYLLIPNIYIHYIQIISYNWISFESISWQTIKFLWGKFNGEELIHGLLCGLILNKYVFYVIIMTYFSNDKYLFDVFEKNGVNKFKYKSSLSQLNHRWSPPLLLQIYPSSWHFYLNLYKQIILRCSWVDHVHEHITRSQYALTISRLQTQSDIYICEFPSFALAGETVSENFA